MLVLMRKAGQSIMIGDDIEVTVVSVDANKVKLSIQAPQEIAVFRRELYDAIKEENIQAARSVTRLDQDIGAMLSQKAVNPAGSRDAKNGESPGEDAETGGDKESE